MNEIILYYSYGGTTARLARQLASRTGAELAEVREIKRPGLIRTFLCGCIGAMKRSPAKTAPITAKLEIFQKITLMAPIWAGHPAPAMNNMIAALPPGKAVSLILVSGSGDSSRSADGTRAPVAARGCEVASYEDVSSAGVKDA